MTKVSTHINGRPAWSPSSSFLSRGRKNWTPPPVPKYQAGQEVEHRPLGAVIWNALCRQVPVPLHLEFSKMPETPPPSASLRHGPREHTPCYSLMPTLDGLVTADLCWTGTPGSLGDSTVFPNTRIPSQPAVPGASVFHGAGKMPTGFLCGGMKGAARTIGGIQMPRMSYREHHFSSHTY